MGVLFSVIGTVISFILTAIIPYIIVFCLGWYCCNKWHDRGANGTLRTTGTAQVISIKSGDEIVTKAGLLGRRSHSVTLWGIEIPAGVSSQATENLKSMVKTGDTIKYLVKEGRKRSRDDISAIVTHNGQNVNLEQLRQGLAKAIVTDKEFVAAQSEAQRAHRGIWQKKDPEPRKPHHPFWHDEQAGVEHDSSISIDSYSCVGVG